jgi:hypothetical protein
VTATDTLGERVLARLRCEFPDRAFRVRPEPHVLVSIASPHPDVGVLALQSDGKELILCLGEFTHLHLACYEADLDVGAREQRVVDQAIHWLREVFADRVEFYGSTGSGGGCRLRADEPRGPLSRWLLGDRTYVWSGPLEPRP